MKKIIWPLHEVSTILMLFKNQNPRTEDELSFDSEVRVNSTTRQTRPWKSRVRSAPAKRVVTCAVVWNWATSTSFQLETRRRTPVSADVKQTTNPQANTLPGTRQGTQQLFKSNLLRKQKVTSNSLSVSIYIHSDNTYLIFLFFCKPHQQQT